MAIVSLACTSCSSEGTLAYYTIEPKVALHSSGATDVSAIDAAYGDRASKQYSTEKQARSEWNAFINAVDDKAVVIEGEDSYYKFSLVLKDEKGDTFVTVKVLETIDWDCTGRHNPSIN